jgi:high frequency lysogenization protein
LKDQFQDRTLALAAVFQAALLVDRLAKTGTAPERNLKTLIDSLFVFDPQSTEDVYGGPTEFRYGLNLGLNAVRDVVDRKRRLARATDIIEYAVSLLHVQAHLRKDSVMLERLGTRLREIQAQVQSLGTLHPDVLAAIAGAYQDTLSTLRYRLHVRGERIYLEDPSIANQVRSLLLAGVRSVILWHQLGGRRWHIPFSRKRILTALNEIA